MEAKNFLRFLFLSLSLGIVLLFTWVSFPHAPPSAADLLDCATNSPWCTSKNRFQHEQPNLLNHPPKPTRRRSHAHDIPHHPLDPLTVREITKVRTILSSHALFRASAYSLQTVALEEPEKSLVLGWKKGDPLLPRKASVVARVRGASHVLTVDLTTDDVTVHQMGPHTGYPSMTVEDMNTATAVPFSSAEFNRTIVDRGVDLTDVACLPISLGWYGQAEEGRRLIKVQCYSMKDTVNFYMRPIEGLTVLVDLDTKQVVEISDKGKTIPIPKATNTDYLFSNLEHNRVMDILNPISIEQPKGPSFVIEDEHLVKWANWEFHLKPDSRAGVIISRAKFRDPDSGELRDVMYKGLASELFVPYMDPTDAWYFKTYMDAGEYGFGLQAMPLDPLNDCPRNAHYMDGVFAAADGTPYVRSNMVCVFESYAGDIGWRHAESPITGMEVRILDPRTLIHRVLKK